MLPGKMHQPPDASLDLCITTFPQKYTTSMASLESSLKPESSPPFKT